MAAVAAGVAGHVGVLQRRPVPVIVELDLATGPVARVALDAEPDPPGLELRLPVGRVEELLQARVSTDLDGALVVRLLAGWLCRFLRCLSLVPHCGPARPGLAPGHRARYDGTSRRDQPDAEQPPRTRPQSSCQSAHPRWLWSDERRVELRSIVANRAPAGVIAALGSHWHRG